MSSQAEDSQYVQPRFTQMEQNTFTTASASSQPESPQYSQPLQTQIGSNTYHTASVATRPSFQEELDSVKSTRSYTDMLAGNDHFFDEVNKEIAEDEARYPLQEESDYHPRFMREKPARPLLAGGTESPPIPTQIEPGREHWVRSQAATRELRFSRITERPVPLRKRNIGKVQAARPPVAPTTRRLLYLCPYLINKRLPKPGKRQYQPDCGTGYRRHDPTPRGVRSEDHRKHERYSYLPPVKSCGPEQNCESPRQENFCPRGGDQIQFDPSAHRGQNSKHNPNTSQTRTPPIKPPTSGANAVPVIPYRSPLLPELSERTRVHLPNSDFPALPKPAQLIAQPNQTQNPWKVINSKRSQAIKAKPTPAQTKAMQKSTKLVSALYPRTEREIIICFETMAKEPSHELATMVWKHVNQALVDMEDIKVSPFFAARFSRNSNLVLTTGLNHNMNYEAYLPIVCHTLTPIGRCSAYINEPWTKFIAQESRPMPIWRGFTKTSNPSIQI
jgi:hypothetical protein